MSWGRQRVQTHVLVPPVRTGSRAAASSLAPHLKHSCGMYVPSEAADLSSTASWSNGTVSKCVSRRFL